MIGQRQSSSQRSIPRTLERNAMHHFGLIFSKLLWFSSIDNLWLDISAFWFGQIYQTFSFPNLLMFFSRKTKKKQKKDKKKQKKLSSCDVWGSFPLSFMANNIYRRAHSRTDGELEGQTEGQTFARTIALRFFLLFF